MKPPLVVFYYKLDCGICARLRQIGISEIYRVYPRVNLIEVDVKNNRTKYWKYWKDLCNEIFNGEEIVPLVIVWKSGEFEVGDPDIFTVEKRHHELKLKGLTERVAIASDRLLNFLSDFKAGGIDV